MSSFLEDINVSLHLKPFVNVKKLKIGEKFEIVSFERIPTKYGDKVVVESKDFKTILPHRFTEKFSEEAIDNLNDDFSKGRVVYLVSEGMVGETTNVIFVEE